MNDKTIIYALDLDPETNRVISATYDQYAIPEQPRVNELPEGDIVNYLYIDGEFIYDPLPEPEPIIPQPSKIEILENKVEELKSQNEMLTECLLEVSEEIYN